MGYEGLYRILEGFIGFVSKNLELQLNGLD